MVFKKYYKIAKEIMLLSVFRYNYLCVIAVLAMALTFASTYFVVQLSSCMEQLIRTFKTPAFTRAIKNFVATSAAALSIQYIPVFVYTYLLQTIMRREFAALLRRYMELSYVKFHSRTAGHMRYCIFLKSTVTPLCTQSFIFDSSRILGNSIFSFLSVRSKINTTSALIFIVMPLVYFAGVFYFIAKRIPYWERLLVEQEKTSSTIYDKLINYDVIKTFNIERSETNQFYESLRPQRDAHAKMLEFTSVGEYLLNYVLYVPFFVLLGLYISNSAMSGDNCFTVVVLYFMLAEKLESFGRSLILLTAYLTQVSFVDFNDLEDADAQAEPREELRGFRDSIELRDVTLYHDERAIVSGINATIRAGEKI
ncbi:hypothetical protein PAPHI01_2605, partial [Pancytospora philotis]